MKFSSGLFTLTLAGIAVAHPRDLERRQTEPVTSTVTGYAHPLSLTALAPLASTATPLSYASPPTAIYVGRGDADAAQQQVAKAEETGVGGAAGPVAVGPVCTSITGSYPTTTVPAFCNPSLMVNAPSLATVSATAQVPSATVTIGAVADKVECCAQCADIYNCVAWQFRPVYVGAPSGNLPGGFDPWGRGDCVAVYHVGGVDEAEGILTGDAASVCPNGRFEAGVLAEGSNNPANATGKHEDTWINLYYNGWNEGSCGNARNQYEHGTDPGTGDNLCTSGT